MWTVTVRFAGQDFNIHEGPEHSARLRFLLERGTGGHPTLHPPLSELNDRAQSVHQNTGLPRREAQRYLRICDFEVGRAVAMARNDWSRRQSW
jgi:hypothetical protein